MSLPDVNLGDPPPRSGSKDGGGPDIQTTHVASQDHPPRAASDHPIAEIPELCEPALAGGRLSWRERTWSELALWGRQLGAAAKDASDHPSGFGSEQPESWTQYRTYVRSRRWLPEGYDGWALEWIPVAYYNSLGSFGLLSGYAWAWLFKRMLRFMIAVLAIVTSVTLWFLFA